MPALPCNSTGGHLWGVWWGFGSLLWAISPMGDFADFNIALSERH